jgi:hypothetical protein
MSMDKVAFYKNQIEKIAQSKWRKLIDSAKDIDELKHTSGNMLRNVKAVYSDVPYGSLLAKIRDDIARGTIQLPDAKIGAKKYISQILSKFHNNYPKTKMQMKAEKLKKYISTKNARHLLDGEDYIDIIHGAEANRIKGYFHGRGAAYPIPPVKVGGKIINKGIFVHSQYGDRASAYAHDSAVPRLGEPGILTGKIQKKYVARHNDYSGGGDEYLIPKEHLDKIIDRKIDKI